MHRFFNVVSFLLSLLIVWLVGCAPSRPLIIRASPLDNQIFKYDQGRQIFISRGQHSSVGLALPTDAVQPGNPFDFHVTVANYSSNPFNFSTDNICVQCEQKHIYVYHPEEALRDQDKRTDLDAADFVGLSPADIQALSPQMTLYYLRRNKELQDFAQNLLQAQTIMPNSTHEGIVRIAFPLCTDKLEMIIKTGEDIHIFMFDTTIK